jgi:hypothetical protein
MAGRIEGLALVVAVNAILGWMRALPGAPPTACLD